MRLGLTKLLLTGVMLSCMTSFGQVATGSLAGTVLDSASSAVPNAKITATNTTSASVTETQSSGAGVYVLPALQPGVYTITVEKQGFKKASRQNVEIRVGQRIDMDINLEIGDVSVSVDVTADAPLLETSTSERGATFAPKLMSDLPLFTGGIRNPRAFLSYMPGVTSGGEQSVSGSGGRAQEVLIDGASLTIPESGGTVFNMPSAEIFGEFRLVQSTFSAEYGRFGGGVEIYTTKSGSSWFHGTAFLNMRRDIWNANTWQRNAAGNRPDGSEISPRLKDRFNEIGGAIGGPVWIPGVYNKERNKTFWFFTYTKDQRPVAITGTPVSTVPTAAMKNGDFSGLPTIYDPATTANGTRTPFANNQIPTARMSRVARNILPLIPNPTRPTAASNYDFTNFQVYDRTIWSLKFDHNFTPGNRLAFFMSKENQLDTTTSTFEGPLGQGLTNGQQPFNYRANHDWTLRPTFLMHTTFGFSAQRQIWDNPFQKGWASRIGIPGVPEAGDAFPRIQFVGRGGYTPWGVQDGKVANGGQDNDTWMFTQGFNWVKGKHEFKFGWDHRRLRTIGFDNAGSNGLYVFNTAQTALPGALATTGNEFASFLLGGADTASSTILPGLFDPIRYYYMGGYFQDNWRVSRKLTLNLGIRYEVPIGWHVPAGFAYMDPTLPNPGAGGRPGAIRFAGQGGAGFDGSTRPYPTDYSNIGPRLGFAYQLTSKTVIRGGWGIYYQTLGNGGCGCRDGFSQSNALQSDGLNAAAFLDSGIPPAPGYKPPPNLIPTLLNFNNASVFPSTFGKAGRIQNWSFNIQHEIKKFLIDVAYQGNRGSRLASSVDLNQLPTSELARGAQLQQSIATAGIAAPFAGFPTTLSVAQSLRPYPQYLSVFSRNAGVGRTWYDALQTKVERRYGGWLLMANHTWSKHLGVAHFRQIFTQTGTATPQDYYNINDSKSYMPMDQTQILNIVTTYELPFGKGKKWLHSNQWMDKAVGGWTISGIGRYASGNLIQITTPGNPLGNGVLFAGVTKANLTGNPISTGVDRKDLDPNNPNVRWFNANAFAAAAPFTLGTSAFFTDAFRQPPILSENIGIVKRTVLFATDKNPIVLNIRADAFNAFNRTSFGGVVGAIGNANFGRPTAPQVGARLITMGLRLEF
jgi:hypothetical protein